MKKVKKDDFRRRAEEALMTMIENEQKAYSQIEDDTEKQKAAARVAMLTDKIQKLDSNTVQEDGNKKELIARSEMIAAEVALTATGFIIGQKNRKFISAFEQENVIRGEVMKSVSKDLMNAAGKAGSYVRRLF